jgi:hypothetical protein
MRVPSLICLLLAFLPACAEEPVSPDTEQDPTQKTDTIVPAPEEFHLTGRVDCAGDNSPWTIQLYRVPAGLDPQTQAPRDPVLVHSVETDPSGAYSLPYQPGPRRRIKAVQDATGREAWPSSGETPFNLTEDPDPLVLNCTFTNQGDPQVLAAAAAEKQRQQTAVAQVTPTDLSRGAGSQLERLSSRGGPDADDLRSAIRQRYKGRLTDEQIDLHMPILLQLADNPREADAHVDNFTSNRAPASTPRRRR